MVRNKKLTVVLNELERQSIERLRASYFAQGAPITTSALLREIIFGGCEPLRSVCIAEVL